MQTRFITSNDASLFIFQLINDFFLSKSEDQLVDKWKSESINSQRLRRLSLVDQMKNGLF